MVPGSREDGTSDADASAQAAWRREFPGDAPVRVTLCHDRRAALVETGKGRGGRYETRDALTSLIIGTGNVTSDILLGFVAHGFFMLLWDITPKTREHPVSRSTDGCFTYWLPICYLTDRSK